MVYYLTHLSTLFETGSVRVLRALLCRAYDEGTWLRMQVDQVWREVMEGAKAAPGCLAMAANAELLHTLQSANRTLEEVQRGLAAYLEIKRLAFPRRVPCCARYVAAMLKHLVGIPCDRHLPSLLTSAGQALPESSAPTDGLPWTLLNVLVQTGGKALPRMRQVLLPVQRRDAGDPGGDQGPAARAAPLQKVLRGCVPNTFQSP